jgi:hypothetical protein
MKKIEKITLPSVAEIEKQNRKEKRRIYGTALYGSDNEELFDVAIVKHTRKINKNEEWLVEWEDSPAMWKALRNNPSTKGVVKFSEK